MHKVSKRAQDIPSFIVMDILEKANELEAKGRDIIHLEIGEPDFPTPQCICDAALEAIKSGQTHYTHSLGIKPLREAICSHYYEKYAVHVAPEQVLVTSGTSPALFMLFSVLLESGDEIIMSDPAYPCYSNFVQFLGAKPAQVDVFEENGFQLGSEEVKQKINPQTKAILINSPSNPTGSLLSHERMAEIAELGLPIISDEIYHGLVYGKMEHSILEYTDNAFVLNGFSKRYAMTGWRLGYIIAPPEYMRALQKIQQNFLISASSISQRAGLAALMDAEADVENMKTIYNERRIYMLKRLRELGFSLTKEPFGAFYIFVNARHIGPRSYDLALQILKDVGVGVAPGIDFGSNGEGFLRLSYANSLERIKEGLDRLESFISHH